MQRHGHTLGVILLSLWSGLNLLVGFGVSLALLLGRNAPALSFLLSDAEIAALEPKALAVVNSLAAFANPAIVAICTLALALIWKGVAARTAWAWWALLLALAPMQAAGFFSDSFLGHLNLVANSVSSVVLATGLVLTVPRRA